MIPLFKSHFSIGKSILTLSSSENHEDSSDSIFSICSSNNINKVVLVEDSLTGFLEAFKNSSELGLQLIFGLRISICDNIEDPNESNSHKVVVFCKNADGYKLLTKIYSFAFTQGNGKIDFKNLKILWSSDDLLLFIPFYDSFIFRNNLTFASCIPDFSGLSPSFFIERNDLPFDALLEDKVIDFCKSNGYNTEVAKSIFYKNRDDFESYQTYKCICNRRFGKGIGLDKPNLDHCGSREFCFESWLELENEIT